jgi:hypothetical protein
MNRIEELSEIIDNHIIFLKEKDCPMLNDTKQLTELLKAITFLENVKSLEGKKSDFDNMTLSDLESRLNNLGGEEME